MYANWKNEKRRLKRLANEQAEEAARQAAYEEDQKWKYLPPSYRAEHELAELIGQDKTDKVKALIEAMIEERLNPRDEN